MTAMRHPVAPATERTSLLADRVEDGIATEQCRYDSVPSGRRKQSNFLGILWLLFIGVFIANADTSLVLATYATISSEFSSLDNASWLLSAYMLSMCSAQPLYGKMSNIFGRKALLVASYILFAIGNLICGIAPSMNMVIVGRFVAGAGGAGMSSVVSFIIADLAPVRDVASYRSYVNIVQTAGKSCGGPIGGKLAEAVGWRWSFIGQVPLTMLAIAIVGIYVPFTTPMTKDASHTIKSRLSRIDFSGSLLLCTSIFVFLLPITMGGNQFPWTHPIIISSFVSAIILMALFVYVEDRIATEPIFPLGLLARRDIVLPYCILLLQNMAQTLMIFAIPLYFQVTASASPSTSGYYLVPAIVGNTIGGLLTAAYIKKTGYFKLPTNVAAIVAGICHTLTMVRWNGNTGPLESLYVFFGGLGTGIAHSSTFIAITAGTTDEELAIAGGGLYLCGGFGSVMGVAVAQSTMRAIFAKEVTRELGWSDRTGNVIDRSLQDVNYIAKLSGGLKNVVVHAYVWAFKANFGLALVCCALSLLLGLLMRNARLPS